MATATAARTSVPKAPKVRRVPLAIYRLKPRMEAKDVFDGALDLEGHSDVAHVAVAMPEGQPYAARLSVRHSTPELPDWHDFLATVTQGLAQCLAKNAANSAALVLASKTVRYAITFGYGRSLLSQAAIERNFGLKVALALIDPDSMKSVGFKEVDYTTFFSNRQSNRRIQFRDFRIDTMAAMLNGVAGLPEIEHRYYTRAIGADALHINPAIVAADLSELLNWLEQVRSDETYKKLKYGWIDQVNAVRDPMKIAALERKLDDDLRSSSDAVFMGAPEPIDHLEVAGFSIVGLRGERHDEIDLDTVRRARSTTELDVAELRKARVVALDHTDEVSKKWPAFEWIGWSCQEPGVRYLLQAGVFYEVDRKLDKSLTKLLKKQRWSLPASWPDWRPAAGEDEGHYNALLAKRIGASARLLDKAMLRKHFAGRSQLEACDVLVAGDPLTFVAVKKLGGPASVSHVIAQGLNGVIAILDDEELRDELADKLGAKHPARADLKRLPSITAAVFVLLLTPSKRRTIESLPFFAKLSLCRAIKEARARGIEFVAGTRSIAAPAPSRERSTRPTGKAART